MPTLAELAGTEYPDEFNGNSIKPKEGRSLVRTITDQKLMPERTFYFEHLGRCGVIEGDGKIVRYRNMPWELYNLSRDRSETENLAAENPEKCQNMITKYENWAKKNNVLPREEVEKAMIYKF